MIVSTLMHLLQQGALWLQNDVNLLPAIPLCGTEQHLIGTLAMPSWLAVGPSTRTSARQQQGSARA